MSSETLEHAIPSADAGEGEVDGRALADIYARSNDDVECVKVKSNLSMSHSDTGIKKNRFSNTVFPLWSQFSNFIHECIKMFVVTLAVHSAKNPKTIVVGYTILALTLISAGFFTNFNINTDEQVIYAPFNSKPQSHSEWIEKESGFPGNARISTMALHADGQNIMGAEQIRKVFQVVETVQTTPGYHEVCSQADFVDFNGEITCQILSVTRFFQHNVTIFENVYQSGGEEAVIKAISASAYENDTPVDFDSILGKSERDPTTNMMTSSLTYNLYFFLPKIDATIEVEAAIIERMRKLQQEWDNDDNLMKLEFFAVRSYSDEFARAIEKDLFLLPIVFFIMVGFTCLVFFRRHKVQSRSILGLGAVITIMFSLMTSFGIMFLIGVPFTSMTQILPFVVFGVGLDDTFIITGAYFRTDPKKDPVERVRETMEEIGLSISVTTITTAVAFALGCISTIPAIYWLNLYAFPTICIDFVLQVTFFIALLVLDERRVQANRMDCCICIRVNGDNIDEVEQSPQHTSWTSESEKPAQEKFMRWYANQLLRPWVKVIVIIVFTLYTAATAYSTTQLTQEFDLKDLLPSDSYVRDFLDVMEAYSSRIVGVGIYFRGDYDQLDDSMQKQMMDYVDELSALPQFSDEPPFCWFRDFQNFRNSTMAEKAADKYGLDLSLMTEQEQIEFAFSIPAIQETYGRHVVFDEKGRITASRCFSYLKEIDLNVVKQQIDLLKAQRAITARQPINQNKDDWSFFTFERLYFIWEFYSVAIDELIFTTIAGVVSICAIGFLFVPHWGAFFFICPLICMLYIELLGTLQFAGLYINAVTYVCLVISIGLLVDFIVHVLLRYYESKELSREDKVKDTLETMGSSILVGGISTFLGVIPLALSTSEILSTVFTCFFAMVSLGVLHGIVFLPVLLSIFGPTQGGHMPGGNSFDGGDELALKIYECNTDESSTADPSVSEKPSPQVKDLQSSQRSPVRERNGHNSFESKLSIKDEVLNSAETFREESLEVVFKDPANNNSQNVSQSSNGTQMKLTPTMYSI